MNLKRLLLATAGAFVFLLVVNALLYPIIFPEGPPEHYQNMRQAPLYQYHLLAFLITAFLMSYLYPLIYKGGPVWKEGLKVGVLMGLFVSLPDSFHLYAMIDVSLFVQFLPALWVCVIWGAAGIVIGLIYGRQSGGPESLVKGNV